MPAPRSCLAGNVSPSSRADVATLSRLAASRPGRRSAAPPSRRTHGSPLRRAAAAAAITSPATGDGGLTSAAAAGSAPSDQDTSAGRMSVATRPGGVRAAATASAASAPTSAGRAGRLHPAGHGARQGVDVGLERRVEPLVVAGMVADDGQQRGVRPPRVVQVGQPVGQAGSQVQQGGGRTARHPAVAVGRAGRHPLEQAEHAAQLRDGIQGRHEVHLRGARVGEAQLHAAAGQRAKERLRPVHAIPLMPCLQVRSGGGRPCYCPVPPTLIYFRKCPLLAAQAHDHHARDQAPGLAAPAWRSRRSRWAAATSAAWARRRSSSVRG